MNRQFPQRLYQSEAVAAIVQWLRHGGRGQLHAACGTGKTLIAHRVADELCPADGLVVVLCPSLALVAQTLETWQSPDTLAVCGDGSIADSLVHEEDLPCSVTTDPARIGEWLRTRQHRRRLIVGTHRSADRLAAGLIAAGQRADLLVVDEAHHTAGRRGTHGAIVHDDRRFPAERRLYLTATPRILAGPGGQDAISMDSTEIFGPVCYDYPFSRAISEGWLDDYRLVVIGVTRPDVLALLRDVGQDAVPDPESPTVRQAVVQIATAKAARRWGLRRVIAFCPRIADAEEFARSLPRTLAGAPDLDAGPLRSGYVHGRLPVRQREIVVTGLAEPPEGGWSVVANVRCLAEGVDIPAVDGVVFTHPKRSTTEIVQALGRALRRDPEGTGTATVLVPILLPNDAHACDDVADTAEFEVLWQVVRALRAHDDLLAGELDLARARSGDYATALPQRFVLHLPDGYDGGAFAEHLTVRIVRAATSPWWDGLAAARAFHAEHGHLDVPVEHRPLGSWLGTQRTNRKQGRLADDRIAALDELGMRWNVFEARFEQGLAAARTFRTEHGHLNPPRRGQPGSWLANQRQRHRLGQLASARVAALRQVDPFWDRPALSEGLAGARAFHAEHGHLDVPAALPLRAWLAGRTRERGRIPELDAALTELGMSWQLPVSRWERGLAAARSYRDRHGSLEVPADRIEDGIALAKWLQARRAERREGRLAADRIAALDELGMTWDPADRTWERGLAAARACYAELGHLDLPRVYWRDGVQLSAWLTRRRSEHRAGRLDQERVRQLEKLGIRWDPMADRWEEAVEAAREFRLAHGHLRVPGQYRTASGFRLGTWIANRRSDRRRGRLSAGHAAALDELGMVWSLR